MSYREIDGDLIKLAHQKMFDVIAHGCNCFCRMGRGIAPQMAEAFGCDYFDMEDDDLAGDITKLGNIDYQQMFQRESDGKYYLYPEPKWNMVHKLIVVNAYTQYHWLHKNGAPYDREALTLCMRKMNALFPSHRIGLPKIGAGLAGGDWQEIKAIIQKELHSCDVTIVNYKP